MKKRRKETATVRTAMEQLSKSPLPERFIVQNDEADSAVIITDTKTNRDAQISIYAYGEVRKALNDLFG